MKVHVLGLSLHQIRLEPILVVRTVLDNQLYNLPLSSQEAPTLASFFHARAHNLLTQQSIFQQAIVNCPKNLTQVTLIASAEKSYSIRCEVFSWFRKKHILYTLDVGLSIIHHYDLDLHINPSFLNGKDKTSLTELQRAMALFPTQKHKIPVHDIHYPQYLLGNTPFASFIM